VQALGPALLILIDHFKATIASIAVEECINHRDLAHALRLNCHDHHVVGARLVKADIHHRFLTLLEQLYSSAKECILDGCIILMLTILPIHHLICQRKLEVL